MLELKGEIPMQALCQPRLRAARRPLFIACCLGLACAGSLPPGPTSEAPDWGGPRLRVGTSGDYPPFSEAPLATAAWAGPDRAAVTGAVAAPTGFDPELARAFARDTGRRIEWVPFRWPELASDLEAERFDVAMSGVTVRAERSRIGRYSLPLVGSGAVALLAPGSTATRLDELDHAETRIGVNRGGHLERVARARFLRASVVAIESNAGVIEALAASARGSAGTGAARVPVDAVVTDTLEAPKWRARVPGSRVLGPFSRDRKAWLVRSGAPELARELDAWLLARERDGSLVAARRRHLGDENDASTALVLPALLAALDERLALMPAVAEAKRASGAAIEDRAREERVLEAGLAASDAECRARTETASIDCDRLRAGVRALLRASIEAAKAIQRRALASAPPASATTGAPALSEIRPALLRIGDRIAWLAVRLPDGQRFEAGGVLRSRVAEELRRHALAPDRIDAFADAIELLSSAASRSSSGDR